MSIIKLDNKKDRIELRIFKIKISHKKKTFFLNPINPKITYILKLKTLLYKYFIQPFVLLKNEKKSYRCLEIGPGEKRIINFETLNTVLLNETDYIGQLGKKLPFKDNSFDILYMSHVLEHIFWHKLDQTISEIYRIIKPGGHVEIWVPDGLKIAKAFVDAEYNNSPDYTMDGWYRFNPTKDPCLWFSGRMFTYGDGLSTNANNHYNVHLSAFSERYLFLLLKNNGFVDIKRMDNSMCRGHDHGWINLGVKAQKPE